MHDVNLCVAVIDPKGSAVSNQRGNQSRTAGRQGDGRAVGELEGHFAIGRRGD